MIYHVVDSVKGGCGKTTFSIMLAQYLNRLHREREKAEKKTASVCLLDMDFNGTGLQNLCLTEKEIEKYFKGRGGAAPRYYYLSEIIREYDTEGKQYLFPLKIENEELRVGFSNPYYKQIDTEMESVFLQGIFRNGVRKVLDVNEISKQINSNCGEVGDVILDMSPGVDPYANAAREVMFGKGRHGLEGKIRRNYYLMLGMDNAHIAATGEYLQHFLEDDQKKMPDRIIIVFNDIAQFYQRQQKQMERRSEDGSTALKEMMKGRIGYFIDKFSLLPDKIKNRFSFCYLNYFEKYTAVIQTRVLLPHADTTKIEMLDPEEEDVINRAHIFEDFPFRYWAIPNWKEKASTIVGQDLPVLEKIIGYGKR